MTSFNKLWYNEALKIITLLGGFLAQNPKLYLILALHNHQPVGNFDHVFEESFRKAVMGLGSNLHFSFIISLVDGMVSGLDIRQKHKAFFSFLFNFESVLRSLHKMRSSRATPGSNS